MSTTITIAPAILAVLNDEEKTFPTFIGNFHKGLRHPNKFGEVDHDAYSGATDSLLHAIDTKLPADFETIPLGGDVKDGFGRKLTDPQAGLATDTEGHTPSALTMDPPPSLNTPEEAAEAAELYWMALLRDVPFTRFQLDPLVLDAAEDLNKLSKRTQLRAEEKGKIIPANIFRGSSPGDEVGPYLSQFLLRDIPYGSLTISQRQRTVIAGVDYLTREDEWLDVQNGFQRDQQDQFDIKPRYIRNMRDLGQYVHVDALYEAYLNACLILLGMGAKLNSGNPYAGTKSKNQAGFGTYGGPHILSLVTEVATRALKAVWYQKWFVWRRLRPEAYGGLVHFRLTGEKSPDDYPIHGNILNSAAVQKTKEKYGTSLLPQAFPEGCPTHPSYGAGHATVAGACVTILKAFFDETQPMPNPVVPTDDGLDLVTYTGLDANQMTVGGELNKVAANIAIGRNMAGVHWRSDYTQSIRLGELVALSILKQQSTTYNEDIGPFDLTSFDGKPIVITKGSVKVDGVEITV